MSGFSPAGLVPRRNRFITLGLAMVVLGWVVLVGDLLLGDAELRAGGLVAVLALKSDIATLAQLLVVTGLGLAILGGLREGFGALNGFFDAVLQRSAAQRPTTMSDADAEVLDDDDFDKVQPAADRVAADRPSHTPGRNYAILPDGSVEVDTLLGTRIFASMDEARDFIR
jgi:hypothetical protein